MAVYILAGSQDVSGITQYLLGTYKMSSNYVSPV